MKKCVPDFTVRTFLKRVPLYPSAFIPYPFPVTFVHSADWHLGQTYWRLGAQATRSRGWRFEAVRRLWQLAADQNAAFILVAGDVFDTETPSPTVRDQTIELLGEAPAPVYLLPGHSDACAEGSVWFNAQWQSGLTGLNDVHPLFAGEVREVEGDALLFPCPTMRKRAHRDVTAWLPPGARGERFRIGLAHGFLKDYLPGENRVLGVIEADRAQNAGLDYLALGGHHAATPAAHSAARARSFYAGTPEIGAHDAQGGSALVIELEAGAAPKVTPHRVGKIELRDLGESELNGANEWEAFVARLGEVDSPPNTIVRARLRGEVSPALWSEMQRWLAQKRDELLGVDVSLESLHARPTPDDFAALKLERLEENILERLDGALDAGETELRGLELLETWSGDPDARREALGLYYRLLGGA